MTTAAAPVAKFGVVDIFDRTFNALCRNPVFLGLAAAWNLPYLLYLLVVPADSVNQFGGRFVVTMAITILVGAFCDAVILHATFQYLRGRPVSAYASTTVGLSRVVPVVIVSILTSLAIGVGVMLLIIPGIIFATMLLVAIPVAVVEGRGPIDSLRRSIALTKGHRLTLFIILIALGIAKLAAGAMIETFSPTMVVILQYSWNTLSSAFHSILAAVAYHGLRSIKEGVDLDQIASAFD